MAVFSLDQRVAPTEAVQGLDPAKVYRVVDVEEQVTPFGDVVTYFVQADGGEVVPVRNGHFILRAVEE